MEISVDNLSILSYREEIASESQNEWYEEIVNEFPPKIIRSARFWINFTLYARSSVRPVCPNMCCMFNNFDQLRRITRQKRASWHYFEVEVNIAGAVCQCGSESARTDTYLDIPLVVRPFGANIGYGSVVCYFSVQIHSHMCHCVPSLCHPMVVGWEVLLYFCPCSLTATLLIS